MLRRCAFLVFILAGGTSAAFAACPDFSAQRAFSSGGVAAVALVAADLNGDPSAGNILQGSETPIEKAQVNLHWYEAHIGRKETKFKRPINGG